MKTDRIDTTQFHITSVQDDQSEIKLSSGSISVDLLQKREKSEDEGITSINFENIYVSSSRQTVMMKQDCNGRRKSN